MPSMRGKLSKEQLEQMFTRADKLLHAGKRRDAFRLMKAGAEAGEVGMQLNVGYMYDVGQGVRRNRERAMYWYRRVYRREVSCGANNIGTIYRDEKKWERAMKWFQRAVDLGDVDANLNIAKMLMTMGEPHSRIRKYLKRIVHVRPPQYVTEDSLEQATALLKKLP